jgi:hypothetical protein
MGKCQCSAGFEKNSESFQQGLAKPRGMVYNKGCGILSKE